MVYYIGTGLRNYYSRPLMPYARVYWEFQAILSGDAHPLFPGGSRDADAPRLWVFRAEQSHGWTAASELPSEVAVLHADKVPELLEQASHTDQFLHTSIRESDISWIRSAVNELAEGIRHGDRLIDLQADSLVLRLSEYVLRGNPGCVPPRTDDLSVVRQTLQQGFSYFAEHMHEGLTVEDIARYCGYSVAHFRRLVERLRSTSPRELVRNMRMERARQLLSQGENPVALVAEACGYSEVASFSRAFRAAHGESPDQWRRRWPNVPV